ncbi:MAG: hypothetical protein ACRDK3_02050 [Actinomycetota bacterium]
MRFRRPKLAALLGAAATLLAVVPGSVVAGNEHDGGYEVWAIDQSNTTGLTYGGTVYIWDGEDIEDVEKAPTATPEKIDLATDVADMCFQKTGANPVRPHMLAINPAQTHAIISFVASGHVVFLDAMTRAPLDCIRSSPGAGGARQVHFAIPSPDETYVAVANQNGKLLERIDTDYATNTFTLNQAATIDLANCITPNGLACEDVDLRPDNAPICPIIDSTSRYSFVTLRGGGLFVVDGKQTPMQIVAEYDKETVHPNGCMGAEVPARRGVPAKMYIDSGGGTPANLFEADLYSFPVTGFSPLNPPNTPAPKVVFSEDVDEADSHGATLTNKARFLWMADRGRNFLWVVDTWTDEIVRRIQLVGELSSDPTPDLLALSPAGHRVFASLRGPNPLTADPHVSTGLTPGVGVLLVRRGGGNGHFVAIAPVTNIDAGGVERADVHALAVRRTGGDE